MKKYYFYIVIALITIGAGFFASTSPDGLDFVSEKFGFAHKGVEGHSLMTGYAVTLLGESHISTIVSGLLGVILISGVYLILNKLISKNANVK